MIKINNDFFIEWEENLTVDTLIDRICDRKDMFPIEGNLIMVIINGNVISQRNYSNEIITDGSDIKIIPFLAGG